MGLRCFFLEDHLQREPRLSAEVRASIASDLERLRNFLPVRELVDEALTVRAV